MKMFVFLLVSFTVGTLLGFALACIVSIESYNKGKEDGKVEKEMEDETLRRCDED